MWKLYMDSSVNSLRVVNKGRDEGGTDGGAFADDIIDESSAEICTSSSEDNRDAVSRSDLKVRPSESMVCWEEPQSMR